MTSLQLIDVLPVHNELGEGVIWNSSQQVLWWTDIESKLLYSYSLATHKIARYETPERLASFALVADEDYLIAAFESGFAYFDPSNKKITWLNKIEQNLPNTRLNDGRADRQGRFWAGSLVESPPKSRQAALYMLDSTLKASKKISNLLISNGLCWSPDSKYMYHTDTPTNRIDRYDFDVQSGDISKRVTFAETTAGISPDGSTVDAEGYLWNAQWGGSQVIRYAPDGKIDYCLELPVSQPTCVAFGGEKLNLLFVTSARQDLNSATLEQQTDAGNLFIYKTPFTGLPESVFKPAIKPAI